MYGKCWAGERSQLLKLRVKGREVEDDGLIDNIVFTLGNDF